MDTRKVRIPIEADASKVKVGTDKSKAALDDLNKHTSAFSSVMRGLFERIGHRITDAFVNIPARAIRAMAGMAGDAIRQGIEFQTALAEVASLGVRDMDRLKYGIQDVSIALGEDLVTTTKAVYQAISASIPEDNVLDFVKSAAMAAKAGLTDTETSVNALTSVINAYGLQATDAMLVSDKFFETIKLGKTRYEELASAIGRVAPLARAAGVSLDEMFGAIAALTRVGLSTEESVTGLRSAITQLLQPAGDAATILDQLGYNAANMAESIRDVGLLKILQDVGTLGDEAIKTVWRDVRGLNAALALLSSDGGAAAVDVIRQVADSQNATQEAFEKTSSVFAHAWSRIKAIMSTIKVTLVEPFLVVGNEILDAIADWFVQDTTLLPSLRAYAEGLANEFKLQFDRFLNGEITLSDLVGNWIEAAIYYVDQLIDRARPFINRFASAFVEALGAALSAQIERMLNWLGSWAEPLGTWAGGGAPAFQIPRSAMFGPGAPPSSWGESAPAGGGGGPVTINVLGANKSPVEIAREVKREIERTRRAGMALAGVY